MNTKDLSNYTQHELEEIKQEITKSIDKEIAMRLKNKNIDELNNYLEAKDIIMITASETKTKDNIYKFEVWFQDKKSDINSNDIMYLKPKE